MPGVVDRGEFVVSDRNGIVEALKLPPGRYLFPRVTRDGKRLALRRAMERNLWFRCTSCRVRARPPAHLRREQPLPALVPDGRRVAFQSDREGDAAVFWQPADGGTAERLTTAERGVRMLGVVVSSW